MPIMYIQGIMKLEFKKRYKIALKFCYIHAKLERPFPHMLATTHVFPFNLTWNHLLYQTKLALSLLHCSIVINSFNEV